MISANFFAKILLGFLFICIFATRDSLILYMVSKTYIKYIWLLNTLLEKEQSFREIENLWKVNPMHKGGLSIRTFHECRDGIKEMFGVDIVCNRAKGNVYYVKNPEVLEEKKLAKWLLRKYSIPQDFVTYNSMKDRILLEEIPLGTAFLTAIIEAMQKNVELQVDYQRYEGEQEEEHLQTFHIQPYALKVFNRRWYLLGYIKEKNDLRIIALDRILDLKVLNKSFELPEDFDARTYFANVVGIFVNKDLPIKVKIRAYGIQAEYLRSTPLHKSQSEGRSKHGEFAEFTYRLCVTPELTSQLLAMGDKVEVLEPEEMKEEIKKRIDSMCNLYK